ncbi:MAG: thiol-disulfide isomerase/thioredoxin [Candidatus Latescibacterota bacterium]|jgi:thiol-disulfide isomerase/thioredoxin
MRYFGFLLVFVFVTSVMAQEQKVPDKALCSVCALKGGESELEKVRAHSIHDGKAYYFCSDGCKKEFDLDPVAYLAPVFPRPAPAFVVETLKGENVSLNDYKDKLILVDFWATWCKPCVEMMPNLEKVYNAYSDKGLVVLGVSIDEEKDRIKKVEKFVDKVAVSYPIFVDAKQVPAWHMFKVKAIPALFLIDGKGQVVAQWTGKVDHKSIEAEILSRLDKKEEGEH